MDDAPPAPDPTLPPAELRRPLAEGAIAAGRPAAVGWASWSFGLTWLLALATWVPWLIATGRFARRVDPAAVLVVLGVLVGVFLLVQVGLMHGRLAAWAAAVNLAAVPIVLLGLWIASLSSTGSTPLAILELVAVEAAAAAAALLTLVLLLRTDARRWFWRASALRSQARGSLPMRMTPRPERST